MTGADNRARRESDFRNMYILSVFAALLCCSCIFARPNGAPLSACSTLTPIHPGFQVQRSSSPYSISVTKVNNKVRVKISSPIGEQFEGFMIQARSSKDKHKIIDGKFSQRDGLSRTIDCFEGRENSLTQVDPSPKNEIVSEWVPSVDLNEDIIFRATVAKSYTTFWTNIDSADIRIISLGSQSSSSPSQSQQDSMYHNCFITKGCFGLPSGCVNSQDCEVLLSYRHTGSDISFALSGFLERMTYMAMGLSHDDRMGNDLVTECFRSGSEREERVQARESWNTGRTNGGNRELSSQYEASFKNGQTKCSWTTKYRADAPNGDYFDLQNDSHYLLLAKGPIQGRDEKLGYHISRIQSSGPVNFTAFESISSKRVSDPIKVHGCFMLTAWVGFASIAILLARHFKTAFHDKMFCAVKVWFALHRALMISALILILTAFIIIFVEKNGWNYATSNPHAILGTTATVLAMIQPFMAAFRPAPDDFPKRSLFNWAHFIVGNSAYILAIVAIFFAVSLESSGLETSFYYVFTIFVIIHVVFHLLFQLHTYYTSGRKKSNDVKMRDMISGNSLENTPEKNHADEVFRVLLLGIYITCLVVIILALYTLIGIA